MRFLLDQSTDARLVFYLRRHGHDAVRVGREHPPGLPDTEVLAQAYHARRILITDDRDFGELVFRLRQPHAGVIYLRLDPTVNLQVKIDRLAYVLDHYHHQLDQFLVVTRTTVRTGQPAGGPLRRLKD